MKLNPRTYLKVIAIIFVLAITSISILFYHAYEEAFSLLKDQFNEEQMLIAKQTAAGIEKNILLLARELETLSRVPAIRELDLGEAESICKTTFAYIRTFGANDIGLIDSKGILLLPLMAPHIKGADFSFRAYFKEARKLEKSTPVFEFIDFKGVDIGKKGIVIAAPIFDSNTAFKGVVVFTIRIAELLKDFALPKSPTSSSWVMDQSGNILFHPRYDPGPVSKIMPNIEASFDRFLTNIRQGEASQGLYTAPDGQKRIASSYPARIAGQTWSVVISSPETAVRELLTPFSTDYALATAAAFIAIVGGSLVSFFLISGWNRQLEATVKVRTEELAQSENKLKSLVETVNDWLWEIDWEGRYIYASPRVRDILGYDPEELIGQTPFDLMPGKEAGTVKAIFQKKAARKEPFSGLENINIHKAGHFVTLESSGTPVLDDQGNLLGYRGVDRDITDRKKAEKTAASAQDRLKAIHRIGVQANASLDLEKVLRNILTGTLEASGASVGMIFLKDLETGHLGWGTSLGLSDAFVEEYRKKQIRPGEGLTGRIVETGDPIYVREASSQDPRIARSVIVAEGLNSFVGVPIRVSGEIIAVMNILTQPPDILSEEDIPLASAIGNHVGSAIRNAQLFQERVQAEGNLKASLQEKELLSREIHHRAKNNMQVISSLLKYQSANLQDERQITLFQESQNRINAMALIHELLYQSGDLMSVDFNSYIDSLAKNLYRSHGIDSNRIALALDVMDAPLGVETAVPIGLVINELVSNSVTHAFPDGRQGIIRISMGYDGKDMFELSVIDDGIGLPETLDLRNTSTLGLKLVINLVEHQLRGTIQHHQARGTEFLIHFRKLEYKDRM